MKNKTTYLRNDLGQYVGGKKKGTKIIVGAILLALALTFWAATAKGSISFNNLTLGEPTGDIAKTESGLQNSNCKHNSNGSIACDFTEDATKARLIELASTKGIIWYTEAESKAIQEKQKKLSQYKAKYPYAKEEVLNRILTVANAKNYANTDFLMALIDCESKFNPLNTNAKGNSPAGSVDLGLLQYNDYWKAKHITRECAFNVECSTGKAIEDLNAGRANQWACTRIVKKQLALK